MMQLNNWILSFYILITCTVVLSFNGRHQISEGRRVGALFAKKSWTPPPSSSSPDPTPKLFPVEEEPVQTGVAFTVDLPKRAGISWGSDLSFRWIYVLDLEPTGEAFQSALIQKVE